MPVASKHCNEDLWVHAVTNPSGQSPRQACTLPNVIPLHRVMVQSKAPVNFSWKTLHHTWETFLKEKRKKAWPHLKCNFLCSLSQDLQEYWQETAITITVVGVAGQSPVFQVLYANRNCCSFFRDQLPWAQITLWCHSWCSPENRRAKCSEIEPHWQERGKVLAWRSWIPKMGSEDFHQITLFYRNQIFPFFMPHICPICDIISSNVSDVESPRILNNNDSKVLHTT